MAGRPERVLDDDGTPLVVLALGLRELRRSTGSPSYREMAKLAHRSQTTLSEAAGGAQLPTWDTVEAYVRACGGRPAEWHHRWEMAAQLPVVAENANEAGSPEDLREPSEAAIANSLPAESAGPTDPTGDAPERRPYRPRRRSWLFGLVASLVVAAAIVTLLLARIYGGPAESPATPAAGTADVESTQIVRDGSDPEDTGCARYSGVTTLDTSEVSHDGQPVGEVQLKYSPNCGAAWPRFQPFPEAELEAGSSVDVDIVRPDEDGARFSFTAAYVGAPIYGNMAVSTSRCVYATVSINSDDEDAENQTHCFRGATFVR